MIPDFSSDIDPASDPEAFIVARFLHDNCFKTVLERDSAGWSPLCYAVVNGDAFLVKALLKSKADPNDKLSKNNKKVNLPKNMPVVCMAAAYYSNDVLEVLLAHRASVNARCSQGATPLAWAASSDNAAAVGILSKAFADPLIKVRGQRVDRCTGHTHTDTDTDTDTHTHTHARTHARMHTHTQAPERSHAPHSKDEESCQGCAPPLDLGCFVRWHGVCRAAAWDLGQLLSFRAVAWLLGVLLAYFGEAAAPHFFLLLLIQDFFFAAVSFSLAIFWGWLP